MIYTHTTPKPYTLNCLHVLFCGTVMLRYHGIVYIYAYMYIAWTKNLSKTVNL